MESPEIQGMTGRGVLCSASDRHVNIWPHLFQTQFYFNSARPEFYHVSSVSVWPAIL